MSVGLEAAQTFAQRASGALDVRAAAVHSARFAAERMETLSHEDQESTQRAVVLMQALARRWLARTRYIKKRVANTALLFNTLPLWKFMELVISEWELCRGENFDKVTTCLQYVG